MKHIATGIICSLLLAATVFCTGCPRRSSSAGESSATETTCVEVADDCRQQTDANLDSIVCGEGCSEYTCYFTTGTCNKKALEHIRAVIFVGFAVVDVDSGDEPASIDRYRTHYLDSLSALEWLDGEPWISMRKLFLDWSEQQLERYYIVSKAKRDPAILYHCSEADSVLVGCADILTGDMSRFVDRVRCFWKAHERAKAVQDSTVFNKDDLHRTLAQIDNVLGESDSTYCARERLFQLLSNHINHKIHNRLGKNGTVDFFSYSDDFLRIFDSVRVETWEP